MAWSKTLPPKPGDTVRWYDVEGGWRYGTLSHVRPVGRGRQTRKVAVIRHPSGTTTDVGPGGATYRQAIDRLEVQE